MIILDKRKNFIIFSISLLLLSIFLFKIPLIISKFVSTVELTTKNIVGIIICLLYYNFYKKIANNNLKKTVTNKINWESILILILALIYASSTLLNNQSKLNLNLLFTLSAIFFFSLAEEIVFRLFYLNYHFNKKLNLRNSIIFSSALFAIAHSSNIFLNLDKWIYIISQISFAFFLGLILACIYVNYKNILVSSLLHFMINIPALLPNKTEIIETEKTFVQEITSVFMFQIFMIPVYLTGIFLLRKLFKKK